MLKFDSSVRFKQTHSPVPCVALFSWKLSRQLPTGLQCVLWYSFSVDFESDRIKRPVFLEKLNGITLTENIVKTWRPASVHQQASWGMVLSKTMRRIMEFQIYVVSYPLLIHALITKPAPDCRTAIGWNSVFLECKELFVILFTPKLGLTDNGSCRLN